MLSSNLRLPIRRAVARHPPLRARHPARQQNSAASAASLFRAPASSVRNVGSLRLSGDASMSGIEWVVEAFGCSSDSLRDLRAVETLFHGMIRGMKLRPVGETQWHQFPGTGGITGLCLLAESHIACHTFPGHNPLCLNLFCCVPRTEWNFEAALQQLFRARTVSVRRVARPYEAARHQAASD